MSMPIVPKSDAFKSPFIKKLEQLMDQSFVESHGAPISVSAIQTDIAQARLASPGEDVFQESIEGIINQYKPGVLTDSVKAALRGAAAYTSDDSEKAWAFDDASRDATQFSDLGESLWSGSNGVPLESDRVQIPQLYKALRPVFVKAEAVANALNEKLSSANDPETAAQVVTMIDALISNSWSFDTMRTFDVGLSTFCGTDVVDRFGTVQRVILNSTERALLSQYRDQVVSEYKRFTSFRSEYNAFVQSPGGTVAVDHYYHGDILRDVLFNDIGKHGFPSVPEDMKTAISEKLSTMGVRVDTYSLSSPVVAWLAGTSPSKNPERLELVRMLIAANTKDVTLYGRSISATEADIAKLWLTSPSLFDLSRYPASA